MFFLFVVGSAPFDFHGSCRSCSSTTALFTHLSWDSDLPILTHTPWNVNVTSHPGSTAEDIGHEPDWSDGHQHPIGFKNRQDRVPGLTHAADDDEEGEVRSVW